MKPLLWLIALLSAMGVSRASATNETATVLVVLGAAGEPEFGAQFRAWADKWAGAAAAGSAACSVIGSPTADSADGAGSGDDRARLEQAIAALPKESDAELWIVLIGHGTFDGEHAKFNLRGSDVSALDLQEWLKDFKRPVALVNCASSSAPFINALSASGRVVVTATKSGSEQNFARFGKYLAEAIAGQSADLDKDGQTSLLEAFLTASREVGAYYEQEGRLATEHALLDDNGDGLGTPADWFKGIRAVQKPEAQASPDGRRAHQFHLVRSAADQGLSPTVRARRDDLELQMAQLRDRKSSLPEEEYYQELERILLELARLYEPAPAP